MTDLDQAVLAKLTERWETAANIVFDLQHEPRVKIPWTPGGVLESLDRLVVLGKAEFDVASGWRLMPERPAKVEAQGRMFG
jgi:hypothetical protein